VRLPADYIGCPGNRVCLPADYVGCPGDRVCLPTDYASCPGDRVCLPADYAGCPGDRVHLPDYAGWSASRPVASPFPSHSPPEVESHLPAAEEVAQLAGHQPCWISGGKIDLRPASRYITSLVHAHVPRLVDSWKEFPPSVQELLFDMFTRRYMFTRLEDLPRVRVIWESTAQNNFRKSMWEARDKAAKTTSWQDPTAWMDDGSHHELERATTFRELFDRTHKRMGTDDYVSESARTIAETYDRTMADRYAEGTPQPDLDAEA
ncbi:hypothetical protein Taro_009433, partial [Colocasia esculenta]|nr:hypothetical protein [Colocasia esculenta]